MNKGRMNTRSLLYINTNKFMHKKIVLIILLIIVVSTSVVYAVAIRQKMSNQISEQEKVSGDGNHSRAYINGNVMHKSDIVQDPDSPLGGALILAIPSDKIMLGDAGLD